MEIPRVSNSGYSNTIYRGGGITTALPHTVPEIPKEYAMGLRGIVEDNQVANFENIGKNHEQEEKMSRRIVRVIIVDTHPDLALDNAILHQTPEHLTDQTDQEIFMELGIKEILDKHNIEVRELTIDKKKTDRADKDIYLEPARIRDLTMQVVLIAQF